MILLGGKKANFSTYDHFPKMVHMFDISGLDRGTGMVLYSTESSCKIH